jgi:putative transposase
MARALRVEFQGAIYHVTARGNERRAIYRNDRDCARFLETVSKNVQAHHIRLYAYVLMGNHYHLLLETPRANLVAFMQQLNGAYTTCFNLKHRRSGHLFGGRYKAKLVEGDEYLLKLTRYVHLNPVKIKRVRTLPLEQRRKIVGGYRWSSYRGYAGLARKESWVDYGPLCELVSRGGGRKALEYRRYVEEGLAEDDAEMGEALARSSKAVGLEGFCRWVEGRYQALVDRQGQPLDAAMRRVEMPASPAEILKAVANEFGVEQSELMKRRSASDARLVAMKVLREEAGLTQRAVAVRLGLRDGSTISRKLSELSVRMKKQRRLRKRYEGLQTLLAHKH